MAFPAKVQQIRRKNSRQWFINFPAALAQAMRLEKGESVEWILEDNSELVLRRLCPPASARTKKQRSR